MSIDRSLKLKDALIRHRNVLTRTERIERLKDEERWEEGGPVLGLPKVAHRKSHAGKKAAKEKAAAEGAVAGVEEAAATTAAAPTAAAPGGKAPAATAKAPAGGAAKIAATTASKPGKEAKKK